MKHQGRWGVARAAALGLAGLGLATLAAASGCATYANYPAIEQDLAVNDPNVHPIPGLVRRALVRVLGDDRTNGRLPERWALNLPRGTGHATAQRVLRDTMDQADVTGGELLTPDNEWLPVYSVTRVWVRGDRADVDVVRPVAWQGLSDRPSALQKITLMLRGGRFKWDVIGARAWPIGTPVAPELYGWSQPTQARAGVELDSESEAEPEIVPSVAASPEPHLPATQPAPTGDEAEAPEPGEAGNESPH